jgi:signal recognition particle GTPase
MYDSIFKSRDKAHTYCKHAFTLAQSLFPRDLSGSNWYKECVAILQRIQQSIAEEEEKKKKEERQPYLDELKDVLIAIKNAKNHSSKKLLEHIYQNHPPKNPEHKLEEITTDNMKKILLKAVSHYHPDRQANYANDRKWVILCEEITKYLNSCYELFK